MEWLAADFGFNHRHRRVRCVGHVINLVVKAIMIGTGDPVDIFEQELDTMAREEREQLIHWRRCGPVGKLHNIIVFICRSTQRIDLFEKLQRLAIDTGFQFTEEVYKLVRDNDTRWNSLFSMIERAVKLRAAIDEFIVKQIGKWTEYETRWQANHAHKKKPPKKKAPPSIIADQLTPDAWHILSQYYRIFRPLKSATIKLQSKVGRHGHIWKILPTLQQLLEHFELIEAHVHRRQRLSGHYNLSRG